MCYVKNHSLARKHGYMTRKQGLLYLSQKHYFVHSDSCDYYVESMFISRYVYTTAHIPILHLYQLLLNVYTCSSVGRALCLESRVSWVRVPPRAAPFSFEKGVVLVGVALFVMHLPCTP